MVLESSQARPPRLVLLAILLRSKHTVFPSADRILEFLWDGSPIIDEGIFDEVHSHNWFPYKEEIFDILMAFFRDKVLDPIEDFLDI